IEQAPAVLELGHHVGARESRLDGHDRRALERQENDLVDARELTRHSEPRGLSRVEIHVRHGPTADGTLVVRLAHWVAGAVGVGERAVGRDSRPELPRERSSPGRGQRSEREFVTPVPILDATKQAVNPAHQRATQPHATAYITAAELLALSVDVARDGSHQAESAGGVRTPLVWSRPTA